MKSGDSSEIQKINVLCVVDFYFPGFRGGGPLQTIKNMCKLLEGHVDFKIFTRNHDKGQVKPYDKPANSWTYHNDDLVYYASKDKFSFIGLNSAIKGQSIDLIYINSFFSFSSSIRILIGLAFFGPELPIILAPRGEFSSGALALKSTKKRAYIILARAFGLYRDVHWHASTEEEKDDILRQFPRATRIHIAEDPVHLDADLPVPAASPPPRQDNLRLVFISRISPMKNLDGLLRLLATLSQSIELDIFGPIEDRIYWASCEALISKLPPQIRVTWKGELEPDAVSPTFANYDLFAFPTHGENFGHVIFEALRAGTPVLISDRTPWKTDGGGAITAVDFDDTESWRAQLMQAAKRKDSERARLRDAALFYAENYARASSALARNLAMFEAAAEDGQGRTTFLQQDTT
jgi:glycosyltransferase involved in cell wall biosynthesis